MKKLIVCVCVGLSVLLSGCTALVTVPAFINAQTQKNAVASYTTDTNSKQTYLASVRALSAIGTVTQDNASAGSLQGKYGYNLITIDVSSNGAKKSTVNITVSYQQASKYDTESTDDVLKKVVAGINQNLRSKLHQE